MKSAAAMFLTCIFAYSSRAYLLLITWVVLCFNQSFRGLLTVQVVINSENRLAGELYFLYVLLFVKLSQN